MKRYYLYYENDFGNHYSAMEREAADGQWVRFEDAQAEIDRLSTQIEILRRANRFLSEQVPHPEPPSSFQGYVDGDNMLTVAKVTSPEPGVQHRIYTHVKTGNQYEVLHDATETTNGSREGRGVVVYRRIGQSAVYVREASEFHEKFVSSGAPAPREASSIESDDISDWWRCLECRAQSDPIRWPTKCPVCDTPRPPAVKSEPAPREASSEPRKDSDYCKHGFAPGHCWFAKCGNRETALREVSSAESAQDRAYYQGARQAAAIAYQSLMAMDKWINEGCGNRVPAMKSGEFVCPTHGPVQQLTDSGDCPMCIQDRTAARTSE